MYKTLQAILKEFKTNKSASTVTNRRCETIVIQNTQPSGSRIDKSIGVRASNIKSSDLENEEYFLRVSEMKYLRHPAKPLYRDELNLDATIVSKEDSDEED